MTNTDYDRYFYGVAVNSKRNLFNDLMKIYEKWCMTEKSAEFDNDIAQLKIAYKKSKCSQIIINAIADELAQEVC